MARSEALAQPFAPTRRRPLGARISHLVLPLYTTLAVVYLLLPIAVMILFGFNDNQGRFNFTWQGFTLRHWLDAFRFPAMVEALQVSLLVAVASTIAATALGTLIGLALTRYSFRGRRATNLLIFLPIATPEVVLGAALLSLFVSAGVARDINTIIISHIMFNVSYVVVTVRARISGFERGLEEAAMDLGANPWTTFWKVTFPLIFPGVMAAALLAFALSIDDFVITQFNAGQTVTFPLWVFGASRIGVPPQVNVMGTLMFAIALLSVAGWTLLRGRGDRRAPAVTTSAEG